MIATQIEGIAPRKIKPSVGEWMRRDFWLSPALCALARFAFAASAFLALSSAAGAQTSVPLLEPKPVFVPGMCETESRNSAFQDHPVKSRTCIASADFDAFRDETMAQYQKSPQFVKDCKLSETRSLPNGFAFSMQCKGSKTILTFRFTKDTVSSTIENLIVSAPKYSSSILTMIRRVGECPGQTRGRPS